MDPIQEVCVEAPHICPLTHAFVFDCDDTILTNPLHTKWWLIIKNSGIILGTFLKHPKITYRLLKRELLDQSPACAEQWQEIFKELGNGRSLEHRFSQFIKKWSHMKTVKKGMDQLLQELKDAGYLISLWTDMGTNDDTFYAKKYHSLYRLFTFRLCVDYKNNVEKPIQKPSPEAVAEFLRLNSQHTDKTTILIDDRLVNCLAAHTYGRLDYIHFKNIQQLRTVLEEKHALQQKA